MTLGMALLFMFVGMSVSLGKNIILLGGKSVTVVNNTNYYIWVDHVESTSGMSGRSVYSGIDELAAIPPKESRSWLVYDRHGRYVGSSDDARAFLYISKTKDRGDNRKEFRLQDPAYQALYGYSQNSNDWKPFGADGPMIKFSVKGKDLERQEEYGLASSAQWFKGFLVTITEG